ncbi:MAG TPA: fructose bisphosphate aldolase [Caulobacteraceae bacterium]|jgi:fructose-bisphosphate aldolase class I|nr:fructose bisphosphate aldolase [Caulobacteraceae bacterium]
MLSQLASKAGFVAALDQSGGSTPGALRLYGVPDSQFDDDDEMFDLVHQMRERIMTAPSFTAGKILAAILFEDTMERDVAGQPTAAYLWESGIVPVLKVDKGLAPDSGGVSLMKPIPRLDNLLERAKAHGVFVTKMRSTITAASPDGVAAIAAQQFELAARIAAHGLLPIIEPEVSIKAPDKAAAESLLLAALAARLDSLPAEARVILKLTLPQVPDLYAGLAERENVVRVLALSGGYTRAQACARLAQNHHMIASFSRALLQDLRVSMTDAQFDQALALAIDEIYEASTVKHGA